MIFIVGIDPGLKGGWAKVTEYGHVYDYGKLPMRKLGKYKIPDIVGLMNSWHDVTLIVIEEQAGLPGNAIGSLAQQCTGYGALLGQLLYHPFKFNIEPVTPSRWSGDLVRAGFGQSKSQTGIKVTGGELFKRRAGLQDEIDEGVLDAAGVALWKAWTLDGTLRKERLRIAREQGLISLGDGWVGE